MGRLTRRELLRRERFLTLAGEVATHGGVLDVPMERIRNVYGAGRTGQHVHRGIREELERAGLRHVSSTLTTSAHQTVTLFLPSSEAGAVIAAGLRLAALTREASRDPSLPAVAALA